MRPVADVPRSRAVGRRTLSAVSRIALSLGLLAALVVTLAARDLRRASTALRQADQLAAGTDELTALFRLESQLGGERMIERGVGLAASMGGSLDTLDRITGVDTGASRTEARGQVDASLAALGAAAPITARDLAAARTTGGDDELGRLTGAVAVARTAAVARLRAVVAAAGPGPAVADAVTALDDVAELGATLSAETIGYFAAVVSSTDDDVATAVARLVVARAEVGALLARLGARPDETGALVRTLRDSEGFGLLDDAVAGVSARSFAGKATGLTIRDLAVLGRVARATVDMQAQVGAAYTTATGALHTASSGVARSVRNDLRDAWLVLAGAALCTALAVLWLVRTVVTPIRALGRHAALVAAGDPPDEPLVVQGARELRDAAVQVNHLVEAVRVVEQQAGALAAGAVDDPVLGRELPGRLGSALSGAVRQLRVSIGELRSLSERLAFDAHHDGLTHLPNRRAALQALTQAARNDGGSEPSGAVLFVDLDGFKAVNDRHGHEAGDQVLVIVAERLRQQVRPGDVVARLGGDEFLVILPTSVTSAEVEMLRGRLVDVVSAPIALRGRGTDVTVGASVGVAFSEPGQDPEELLRTADAAMYAVKARRTT